MPPPYARRHMLAATRTNHGPNGLVAVVGTLHLHIDGQNQAQISSDMGTSSDPVPAQRLARHKFGGSCLHVNPPKLEYAKVGRDLLGMALVVRLGRGEFELDVAHDPAAHELPGAVEDLVFESMSERDGWGGEGGGGGERARRAPCVRSLLRQS